MNKQHDNEKDIRSVAEKLAQFDLQELRELSANALQMRDEVMNCINRLNVLDSQWLRDKEELREIVERTNQDLKDLQKYIMGKIDVGIEADADLRRDQQILNERMQLIADDLRLLMEEHQRLANRTLGVVEENEEMRTLLGQVREDNEHLRHDNFQVSTRVLSLEGAASEKWQEFTPAVLYFRNWHRTAKGDDVQLSADLSIAVGRGFLAATGVVIGNTEGLAVGDGPCRHFGTPGCFSSYYELEMDEVTAAPAGAGGLFVGVSLQSGEEITNHPRKEFDGWLIGGSGKALTIRASCAAEPIDAEKLPDTFAPTSDERSLRDARKALKLLRAALPPLAKGKVEEDHDSEQFVQYDSVVSKAAGDGLDFQSTAQKLLDAGGVGALYKGTDATILATGVMGFASFGLNELFRRSLEKMNGDATGEPSALLVLAASIAAVFVSGIIAAPFETLRVRVMAPTEGRSWGELATEAVSKGFSELWAGLWPFWAREIPFSACKFLVFDLASRALFSLFPAAADAASLEISAVAGAIAGLCSAVVSNPADVIITQISFSSGGDTSGRRSLSTLNLWKGLGARSVYFAAAICAQFLLYDSVKELLGVGSGDLQLVLDVFGISRTAESLLG
ncbi:PIC2 [Symbiodinium pilosum]|uniref:PIC2 protein n=1 Tax=Symbiodinium pilosum TaxID=2952 RepID=A0A812QDC6_SYMPI|nr:PIC2 [Symbiodinium pilosum]